jgi:hypothetical protein
MHLDTDSARSRLRRKAEDLMIELLRSPSPTLRFWACFGVGTLVCQRAVAQLRKLSARTLTSAQGGGTCERRQRTLSRGSQGDQDGLRSSSFITPKLHYSITPVHLSFISVFHQRR